MEYATLIGVNLEPPKEGLGFEELKSILFVWFAVLALAFGVLIALSPLGDAATLPGAGHSSATHWSVQSTPNVAGAGFNVLYGVSCDSAVRCTAVGTSLSVGGPSQSFAEQWNGSTWTLDAPANVQFQNSRLYSVSCPSSTSCVAVGGDYAAPGEAQPLAELWSDGSWLVQSMPPATDSELNSVSCPTTQFCMAVGWGLSDFLIDAWNGSSWTTESAPTPPGTSSIALDSVACTSAVACTAIGSYLDEATNTWHALAEGWDGSSWALEAIPTPSQATYTNFKSVACSSPTTCIAVGDSEGGSEAAPTIPLVETLADGTWTIAAPPTAGTNEILEGVSCLAGGYCMVVGNRSTKRGWEPVAEVRRGTWWSVENPLGGIGVDGTLLNQVSCFKPRWCTAVGSYVPGANTESTLAEARQP
jgi:hypothetical protein